ncbi:class I SAM-dependent methyltransferase [Parvularcula sp. LCG005]|uniref:class I SAM-dependent methyltransferase n=1 Tax=Parvularcula sp. LCG005 TaxID=3078805 RepID=UPI002941EBB8|nr:methyltransferase domain-containing protein [Parvularcula sp. LCG005]WOI53611.1 methyltransferase domain-containing protein [Parvularcula sp. LCG005]
MSNFRKKYDHIKGAISSAMSENAADLWGRLASGGNILEYGCGDGVAALAMAHHFPRCNVLGVDLHNAFDRLPERALSEGFESCRPTNLGFAQLSDVGRDHAIAPEFASISYQALPGDGSIDFCYSWCVFEHINLRLIEEVLNVIRKALSRDGLFYLKINPLYFSNRGAHLNFILDEPWVHLLHEHHELERIFYEAAEVKNFKEAKAVWYQYITLNRLTADVLSELIEKSGFSILHENRLYEGKPSAALLSAYNEEALRNKEVEYILRRTN